MGDNFSVLPTDTSVCFLQPLEPEYILLATGFYILKIDLFLYFNKHILAKIDASKFDS